MHRTILKTPIINTVLRQFSVTFLRLSGWKIEGQLPAEASKCVFIAAPHTSNWDLPFTLMVAFALRLNIYWMGKASIFRFPFGGVMGWLGGIVVNREQSNNLVAVLMAYMDYSRKISGIGPMLTPTGNIENDIQVVKDFYAAFKGKNADQFESSH